MLDLDDPAGQQQLATLAAGADILIESTRPGTMDGRGLAYDDLAAANPALVYVSITAFGSDGPKAQWAESDLTVLAAGGPLALTGNIERPPVRVPNPQGYLHAAVVGAGAALTALLERNRSGRGQHVDVSAQVVLMNATQSQVLAPWVNADQPVRSGVGFTIGETELRFVYPASDGHVSITHVFGASVGPFTKRLTDWANEQGFVDDETAATDWVDYGMAMHTGEVTKEQFAKYKDDLAAFTASMTKAELAAGAKERRLLLAPLATTEEVLASEQFASRAFWDDLGHPELGRSIRYPGAWAKPTATPLVPLGRAPQLGEHTEAVLGEAPRHPAVPASAEQTAARSRPLEGVKVLDFMWAIAGPTYSRALADFGATVIRIETEANPDACRSFMPFVNNEPGMENNILFSNMNAGKLGLSIDLSNPDSLEVVHDLVRWADVVTEAFSPKAMKGWNLHYEALREVKPEIIMVSSCLMGQTGPEAMFAGFGNLAAAVTGFYNITGWPDLAPAGPYGAYTDYVAPHFTLVALLAAIDHKNRTSEGQYIDFSQAEAALHFLAPALLEATANGRSVERRGNADLNYAPHGVYPASGEDRWVAVVCETDDQWAALAEEMGRSDLAGDGELRTASGRLARRDELDAAVAAWTAVHEPTALQELLQARGVPAHQVQNAGEIHDDPQVAHMDHFRAVVHPVQDPCIVEGPRFRLSVTPGEVSTGGPMFNEHLFEVLSEHLGYDPDKIADLIAAELLQ